MQYRVFDSGTHQTLRTFHRNRLDAERGSFRETYFLHSHFLGEELPVSYTHLDVYKRQSVISSIAGTKGLGVAPSYSATKRYQNIYIDALAQLSRMEKQPITFTDIRPGFVRTDLLKDGRNYPMLMSPQYAALRIANAIDRKKRRAIIDWRYAILVFLWRLIPEWLWERLPIRN